MMFWQKFQMNNGNARWGRGRGLVLAAALALILPLIPAGLTPLPNAIPAVHANPAIVDGANGVTFISDLGHSCCGSFDLYSQDFSGANPTLFASGATQHAWSPDGSKIAYDAANGQLTVANKDGSNPVGLGVFPATSGNLAWSPDGTRIAFEIEGPPPVGIGEEATVINANGGGQLSVFGILNDQCFFEMVGVSWLDNSHLVIANDNQDTSCTDSRDPGLPNCCLFKIGVPAGGAQPTPINTSCSQTNQNPVFAPFYPTVSPDGSKIAYNGLTSGGFNAVFTMSPSGGDCSASKQVTPAGDVRDQLGGWSPGGKDIVYSSQNSGSAGNSIEYVPAGGGTPVNLTPAGWAGATTDNQIPEFRPARDTVSVANQSFNRPSSGGVQVNIPVTLAFPANAPLSVNYSVTDGTATSTGQNPDYRVTPASGTLNFAFGDQTKNIVATIFSSTTSQSKTFTVTLSGPSGVDIGNSTATITILPLATVSVMQTLTVSRPTPSQGSQLVNVPVQLNGPIASAASVDFTTADVTATSKGQNPDYSAPAMDTLHFQAGGSLTQNIPVTIYSSSTVTDDRTFSITLSNPQGPITLGNTTEVVTISHSHVISIADKEVNRPPPAMGTNQVQIPVTISAAPQTSVTVQYVTADISATSSGPDRDYDPVPAGAMKTITFPAGSASTQNIPITIHSSTTASEPVTFSLTLSFVGSSPPQDVVLGQSTARITIQPSALIVNDNGDGGLVVTPDLGICKAGTGPSNNILCTLRAAIQLLDASNGQFSAITFAMPGAESHLITVGSGVSPTALPVITQPVTIDGSKQEGVRPQVAASSAVCLNAGPGHCTGLDVNAANVGIRGVAIYGFRDPDVRIDAAGSNATIQGDAIGTDFSGMTASNGLGIEVDSAGNVTIGGSAAGQGNLIGQARQSVFSGAHSGTAIYLSGAGGTTIQGNTIGMLPSPSFVLSNDVAGIWVDASTKTTIGGTSPGTGNLILASGDGIRVTGAGSGLDITGNQVGPRGAGHSQGEPIDNSGNGISVSGTLDAVIHDNIVTGSGKAGIVIDGSAGLANLQGNFVGTDPQSNAGLGNTGDGILVKLGASAITIGGAAAASTCAGPCNLIGSNKGDGVHVQGGDFVHILGNFIGVSTDGMHQLPNGAGVVLEGGAFSNEVGAPDEGNLIDFNDGVGVQIGGTSDAASKFNSVMSNSIYLNGQPTTTPGIQLSGGANEGITPPKLVLAATSSSASVATVMFRETTPGPYQVQVFASSSCNANGQGQTLVGTTKETHNGTFPLKLGPAPAGEKSFTATITDAHENTSQFSNCFRAK
jgi:hypothetical protein